jgi:flagellin
MSDIALSAGVRQNLLALQQTSAQMITTQNDLATGKKVNSALDNPISYFLSQSLTDRANELGALLDQIGQAVQTLNAANDGITSLTSLVQSAKSIATQAQETSKGTVNYTNILGNVSGGIAVDQSRVTGTTTIASGHGNASVQGSLAIDLGNVSTLSNDDTIEITNGTTSAVFQYLTSGNAVTNGNYSGFGNASTLATDLSTVFGGNATVTAGGAGNNTITISTSNAQDYTTNYSVVAGSSSDFNSLTTQTTAVNGDTLTVSDGTHIATFRYVTTAGNATDGTFSDVADLLAAIGNSSVAGDITAGNASGYLQLTAAKTVSITVGGNIGADQGFGNSSVSDNYNSTLAGLSGTLTIQVGSDDPNTLDFGSGYGQISTVTELSTALSAINDITGSINSSNQIDFAPTSSANVTIGGTTSVVGALGLTAGTTTPAATVVTPDPTRESLQDQYNDLLTQIDQLAGDSSYNGVNLLDGDNLNVIFNETSTSGLTIQGVNLDAAGIGLNEITGTGFQDNNVINNVLNSINNALTTLRSQASTFGSNLTTVQTRQDFTNNLINTLQTGSDNLVLADTNAEGADLLALQTRQQLSTTALSLSAQADQNVLKLFGG